ncbi:MAG TPA: type II toxin-antitoxin system RelE/ParE family toxin [Mucilaginibacter sp.]|jgi:hypothetical protein|nr:type II toxin-antitoxin system RelE/ParE family toxin [Mucilaginibacter sp.]
MSLGFLQLPKAKLEIIEAWEWYEDQRTGLGDQFVAEVEKKIIFIRNNPLHYPAKGKYREAQIDIFPFLIVYKLDKAQNIIQIISVFHTSRHPKKKYK